MQSVAQRFGAGRRWRGRRGGRGPLARSAALATALALVLAACGDEVAELQEGVDDADTEEPETAAPEDDGDDGEPDAPDTDDAADDAAEGTGELEVVDGVLQPLPDGFPSEPITLWQPFEPGSDDDVFNQLIARVGERYSPVPVSTETQQMGPGLHYELVSFLEGQPGADEGHHLYVISWFGLTTRPFTNEELAGRPWDELRASLRPINRMTFSPYSFLAPLDGDFQTIEDVEQWALDNPGELRVSSSSPGGGIHSSTLVWAAQAGGIELTYIPTDSPTEARQVLLGGGADMATSRTEPGLEEQFEFLMVTGDNRLDSIPDVPSAGELGYSIPGGTDRGFGTLEQVPQEHVDWLHEWLRLVSEDEEFRDQYEDQDLTYVGADGVEEARDQVVEVFVPILEDEGLVLRDDY